MRITPNLSLHKKYECDFHLEVLKLKKRIVEQVGSELRRCMMARNKENT
jgi:hypothetical protein